MPFMAMTPSASRRFGHWLITLRTHRPANRYGRREIDLTGQGAADAWHLLLRTGTPERREASPRPSDATAIRVSFRAWPWEVLQRLDWPGSPVELGELFVLTKNKSKARCALLSHQFGWELRLFVGGQLEVVQSQVCRSQDEVPDTSEQWKAAMIEKGSA